MPTHDWSGRDTVAGVQQHVEAAETFARQTWDVISTEQARQWGVPRQSVQLLARSGRWRRLLRGVYWTSSEARPSAETAGYAALLFAGRGLEPRGVLSGVGAARVWHLDDSHRGWRPEVVLGPDYPRPQPKNVTYRFDALAPGDVTFRSGLRVTTPPRTLTELAVQLPAAELLVLGDAALRTRLLADLNGLDHPVFRLADGRAESAFESRVRAELIAAGLPPPALQHVVIHDGAFVARVDLAWPDRRLAIEADGAATHASPEALRRDLRRQNALVAAGWTVLRFTWSDLGAIADADRDALRAQPQAA